MTEQEWQDCTNLGRMLEYSRHKVSIRKLRLFACAFCRQAWNLPSFQENIRRAVETAEMHADGLVRDNVLARSHSSLMGQDYATGDDVPYRMEEALLTVAAMAATDPGGEWFQSRIIPGAHNIRSALARAYLSQILYVADDGKYVYADESVNRSMDREETIQCNILRDLFGPPPFHSLSMAPACITWRNSKIKKLAKVIVQERRYEDMPKIADALEAAGCTSHVILDHCRNKTIHVKGCWVLDDLMETNNGGA